MRPSDLGNPFSALTTALSPSLIGEEAPEEEPPIPLTSLNDLNQQIEKGSKDQAVGKFREAIEFFKRLNKSIDVALETTFPDLPQHAEVRRQLKLRKMELQDTVEIMEQALMDGVVDETGSSVLDEHRQRRRRLASPRELQQALHLRTFFNIFSLLVHFICLIVASSALHQLNKNSESESGCVDDSTERLIFSFLVFYLVEGIFFFLYNVVYFIKLVEIDFNWRKLNKVTRDIFEEESNPVMSAISSFVDENYIYCEVVIFIFGWIVVSRMNQKVLRSCGGDGEEEFAVKLRREVVTIIVFGAFQVWFNLSLLVLFPLLCCLMCCLVAHLYSQHLKSLPVGMADTQLRRIKTQKFAKEEGKNAEEGEDEKVCSVCLCEFEEGAEIRVLPCSGHHVFHKPCIDVWLKKNDTCPQCRTHLIDKVKKQSSIL